MAKSAFTVKNGVLLLDDEPFPIRGVNWNPVPKNKKKEHVDFVGAAKEDIPRMAAAGINAVRTYRALDDVGVLNQLHAARIFVFTTVYTYGRHDVSRVKDKVAKVQDHPAIAVYVLGNEWNLNCLYTKDGAGCLSVEEARDRLNKAAQLIKKADPTRPVASIWSDSPGDLRATVLAMPLVDLWGVNLYRRKDFNKALDTYRGILHKESKPLFLGEYGRDAYHPTTPEAGLDAQAATVADQARELHRRTATLREYVAGGFVFEWCDEWWKAGPKKEGSHEPGPHKFHEAWFGLVDTDRKCRPAYKKLQSLWGGRP